MFKKKNLTFVLAILILGIFVGAVQAASPTVVLNGQQLTFDVPPVIDDGRTLVPLRTIFESLGADVNWDVSTSTVTAKRDNTTISLQIGNATAYKNGSGIKLDVPAKLVENRTMVPLRFVSEALGCSVSWNPTNYIVEITSYTSGSAPPVGYMKASIIDVGQADSILIQLSSGENILIDAGKDGTPVIRYLQANKVSRIDDLIITHPHADHIGGMDDVIRAFDIGQVYMPQITNTTDEYNEMISAINAKGLKITPARAGVSIDVDSPFKGVFLAPISASYDDLNNYSAVLKLTYGQDSFLFTGDAEEYSELEMQNSKYDLQADLIKIGHHGSTSSSTYSFLKAVNPEYAVISVGADNDYGHPSDRVISRLNSIGTKIYRTDEQGTIIATSDGTNITINTAPSIAPDQQAPSTSPEKYIGNKNSKKFHLPSCQSLPAEYNRVYLNSREEAISKGYEPCGNCKP
ncbi:MAG: MBL fold metallo-hydrolase [Syntrophomonadaceae bacterium]|nr:MBL fold metallo-hydrolase [Syntrophomonadaceae bacterium]